MDGRAGNASSGIPCQQDVIEDTKFFATFGVAVDDTVRHRKDHAVEFFLGWNLMSVVDQLFLMQLNDTAP